jgi:uncharacterized membrane protein
MSSVSRFIKSYPGSFGIVIGLALASIVVVIAIWFPRTEAAWERNNAWARSAWFAAFVFVFCICRFWRLRHQRFFWLSIILFFLIHIVGVAYYSIRVHPPTMGQSMLLLAVEWLALLAYFDPLGRNSRYFRRRLPATERQVDLKKTNE